MKNLAELKVIRDKMKSSINLREDNRDNIRVVVGMATCGIAAGARTILNSFIEELDKTKLDNVTVLQTGCIGICQYEPVVEVINPDGEKTTYVKVTAEKVAKIVNDHIVNGKVVAEYTIGSVEK